MRLLFQLFSFNLGGPMIVTKTPAPTRSPWYIIIFFPHCEMLSDFVGPK